MSTEVTPESLRTHALFADLCGHRKVSRVLEAHADQLDHEIREQARPLPTVPGWYPTIVVERGGESCTGALLADDDGWRTAREVDGRYGHWIDSNPNLTIRWAEQDGKTPGQTLWEAEDTAGCIAWCAASERSRALYERRATAVLAAHGTPNLTPMGEHPEPGTRGLLPVVLEDDAWQYDQGAYCCLAGSETSTGILADPRPDGAQ